MTAVRAAALAALLLAGPALADDAPMSLYGGSARVMDEGRVPVSMDSEVVLLTLDPGGYDVRVTFRFTDHGASTTVPVGFPVVAPTGFRGGPDPIRDFATWADGERLPTRTLDGSAEDSARYAPPDALGQVSAVPQALRWLVADIPFRKGKTTTVRVFYRASYDPDPPWSQGAHYLFGTGAAWQGPIGSALFVVDRGDGVAIPRLSFSGTGTAKPETMRLGAAITGFRFAAIEPPPTASLEVEWPSAGLDEAPLEDADGRERPPLTRYEDWRFVREPVTDADLEPLSPSELWAFRSAFEAGHGKPFDDAGWDRLFRRYPWYAPRKEYRESDLNPVEAANVKAIAARIDRFAAEASRGGAFDLGDLLWEVSSGRRLLAAVERGDADATRTELRALKSKADGAYLIPARAVASASRAGQAQILTLLLDAGADPEAAARKGRRSRGPR